MYFIIVVFLVVIIIVYVSYLTPTHTREPILLCTLVCVCERAREESAVRERDGENVILWCFLLCLLDLTNSCLTVSRLVTDAALKRRNCLVRLSSLSSYSLLSSSSPVQSREYTSQPEKTFFFNFFIVFLLVVFCFFLVCFEKVFLIRFRLRRRSLTFYTTPQPPIPSFCLKRKSSPAVAFSTFVIVFVIALPPSSSSNVDDVVIVLLLVWYSFNTVRLL